MPGGAWDERSETLTFQVLGPIDACREGRPLALSGVRRRAVLARLLLDRGRPVSSERLIEDVWEAPSEAAAATLQSHVSQLRRVLGGRLTSVRGGYLLDLTGASLDATEFENLVDEGSRRLASGDCALSLGSYERALALWRGPALAEVADRPWAAPEAARLEDRREEALEDILEARLELGEPARVVSLAERAVAEDPLRERRWALLMVALYRCGRQAAALEAYERVRRHLSEELGIDPSPMLVRLHRAVLRHDPVLLGRSRVTRGAAGSSPPGTDLLERARVASWERDWKGACELLREADGAGLLDPERLMWLGALAYVTSQHELSISAHERAYAGWLRSGEGRRAAAPAMALVANHFIRHRPSVAAGWFHRGTRLLGGEPEGPEHGLVAFTAARLAMATGNLQQMLESAAEARRIGRRFGVADIEAVGLALEGAALIRLGRAADGVCLMDEALALAMTGQLGPVAAGLMLCWSVQNLLAVADLQRASEWVETMSAAAGTGGAGGFPGDCRVHRAEVLQSLGLWNEAEREARAACEEIQDFDLLHAGAAHAQVGFAQLQRGDLAGADTSFRQASACGASPQPGLALLHLARSDTAAAVASIEGALADPDLDAVGRARLLPARVDIAIAAGQDQAAAEAVAELEGCAERYGSSALQARACTARAALALSRGDPAAAVAALRRASRLWQELRALGQSRLLRTRLAEALDALGDHAGAELERTAAGG